MSKRYGLQVVAVDAASVGVGAMSGVAGLSVGGYLLGGPLVHVAHGNSKRAVQSLFLRVSLPSVGMLVGLYAAGSRCEERLAFSSCGFGEMAIGALAGVVTAMVLDAAVLAKEARRVGEAPATISVGGVAANRDLRVIGHGGVTLGLTGRF